MSTIALPAQRRHSRLRELRIVIGVEVTMWARENGLTSHARSTAGVIVTLLVLAGVGGGLISLAVLLGAALLPELLASIAGPAVLLCQAMMLGAALGATSASSRTNAQLSPYRRLYRDALRIPETIVVFVRGQLLPLIRIGALAVIALMFTVPAGPLPFLFPGTLALAVATFWYVLRVVPVKPNSSRVGIVTLLVAITAGVLLGLLFRALPALWNDQPRVFTWLAEISETLRWTAQVAPAAAIATLAVAGAAACAASRRTQPHALPRYTAGTWLRAFLAMTVRSAGRGAILLRRMTKPLAISVTALTIAAAIAPAAFTGDHAIGIALRAVPLVVAVLVITALSSFFGAIHVLPVLNLAAQHASARTTRAAVTAYLGVLVLWIAPAPIVTALALAILTGDPRIVIAGATTAVASVAGLMLGSLFDRYALRLPDGTIELSLWGHLLTGLVPTLLTGLGALGGTAEPLTACVLAVLAVLCARAVLIRKIRPL